jgi:hypothetical protein
MMKSDIPSFQKYQQAFTAHVRDPLNQSRPNNVSPRGMNVYKDIVFNNLFDSVSACFPVAQKVIGKRAWLKLVRGFFRDHSSTTPIFRKIPEEFLSYLEDVSSLVPESIPPFLTSLCHYEWVELLVATTRGDVDARAINPTGDLRKNVPSFAIAIQLLNYEYAVQKISPGNIPKEKTNTQLLVYRNADFAVKFIELNAITYRLIEILKQEKINCEQALTLLASEMNQGQTENIIQFGLEILEDLRNQDVILGTYLMDPY